MSKLSASIKGVCCDEVNGFTKVGGNVVKGILDRRHCDKWVGSVEFAKAYDSLNLKMPWLRKVAVSDLKANLTSQSQQQSQPRLN